MLKKKPFLFALVYCVFVIAFKLFVFYNGLQMTKVGMYSHILSLLLMTPFILLLGYLVRKEHGGEISAKVILRQGLVFMAVSALVLSVFNYIFFQQELGAYIANYIQTKGPASILEEAKKNGKTVSSADIDKMIKGGIEDLSPFKDTTSKLFSILVYGIFSSFIASIFLKRNSNA
jgi:hypothetical protein